jgi:hypothetical protein
MRDLEFILRFFALSSDRLRQETKQGISLKRFLNVFMEENRNPAAEALAAFRERFIAAIDFLHRTYGDVAFHNLSSSHPDRLVDKFNPTVFDSILIATDFALRHGPITVTDNPEAARRALLADPEYRVAISKETMQVASIRTRISKATRMLFGLEYA